MKNLIQSILLLLLASGVNAQTWSCGDSLVDARDGKKYATVRIGSQCWMAQNLDIGNFVVSTQTSLEHSNVSNNQIIEKYCFDNDTANCIKWGGLYDWNELMNYSNSEGGQGICPADWHVPTDAEWKAMEASMGMTSNDISAVECSRGSDEGLKLKENGVSGFNVKMSGGRDARGYFAGLDIFWGLYSFFWTSTDEPMTMHYSGPWRRTFIDHYPDSNKVCRTVYHNKYWANSVRCIKNSSTSGLNQGNMLSPNNRQISLSCYPNPGSGIFNLKLSAPLNQSASLQIIDMNGREITLSDNNSFKPGFTEGVINLEELDNGIYFIHLSTNNNATSNRLKIILIN